MVTRFIVSTVDEFLSRLVISFRLETAIFDDKTCTRQIEQTRHNVRRIYRLEKCRGRAVDKAHRNQTRRSDQLYQCDTTHVKPGRRLCWSLLASGRSSVAGNWCFIGARKDETDEQVPSIATSSLQRNSGQAGGHFVRSEDITDHDAIFVFDMRQAQGH